MKWRKKTLTHRENKSDNNGMWREHDLSLWVTIIFTVYTHTHTQCILDSVIENYVWWHGWLFANQFDILHIHSHNTLNAVRIKSQTKITLKCHRMNNHRKSEWVSESNLFTIVCKIEIAGHTRTHTTLFQRKGGGERRNETWIEFQIWIKQKNFYLHTQKPFG